MGSPLSPILADIVMEEMLAETLATLPYKPKLLTKYVDDLFVILPREHIQTTLLALNQFYGKIQFTVETEVNGAIPYFDVNVIREGSSIITDWYRKPTAGGRIINYRSHHPRYQILNTASSFIAKVLGLSHKKFHTKNKNIIYDTLKQSGFPRKIITNLIIKQDQNKSGREAENKIEVKEQRNKKFRGVHYVAGFSERMGSMLKKYNEDLCLAHKTSKTVKQCYSCIKDRTPKEQVCNVVYNIPCKGSEQDNCTAKYVGTTGQLLKNRISSHRSDLRGAHVHKTALTEHCASKKHVPDFDNVKILCKENNFYKRMTLEALHIYTTEGAVNKRTDLDNINSTYCALVCNQKQYNEQDKAS